MHRNFLRGAIICLLPCILAGFLVGDAYLKKTPAGERGGGFKLGIDLVGGTILVYEVDKTLSSQMQDLGGSENDRRQRLTTSLKRRLDESDLKGIVIRPLGDDRVEIVLPSGTDVDEIKDLVRQVGSLEFRICANEIDDGGDAGVITAIQAQFNRLHAQPDDPESKAFQRELDDAQLQGLPPPVPPGPVDGRYRIGSGDKTRDVSYQWVEVGKNGRESLGLANKYETPDDSWTDKDRRSAAAWTTMKGYRERNDVWLRTTGDSKEGTSSSELVYGRECKNRNIDEKERAAKKYEYFVLTRVADTDNIKVQDPYTLTARGDLGEGFKSVVAFKFNTEGGNKFYDVTKRNEPTNSVKRQLAILLDGKLVSNPTLNQAIHADGQISGDFTKKEVEKLVNILRSGALPATLKPLPVAENTVGPTLGKDTVQAGLRSVACAFLAVLVFMVFYYQFAGLVASVALLANLLLTVGFMLMVDATFTLPGLAGLVLMLGMAVDANVLIYERIREERDKGSNLLTALRNGYDRAFPTIIDTHLSSIFTAVVLYAVGNDQLKGFGVSLTLGLIISLFTSLFVTRLIFDFWLSRGWLTKLNMFRLLTRPKIDFMRIRHLMFAITGTLTILGISLFLYRGKSGLNVDFVGGTVYSGKLSEAVPIEKLRGLLDENRQKTQLAVEKVTEVEGKKNEFEVTYAGESLPRHVAFATTPAGGPDEVKRRLSELPNWSVEQIFTATESGRASRYFTVRTTELEADAVQTVLDRLFTEDRTRLLAQATLTIKDVGKDKGEYKLTFADAEGNPARTSQSYIKMLLEREFRKALFDLNEDDARKEAFNLYGDEEESKDGRHASMTLKVKSPKEVPSLAQVKVDQVLAAAKESFTGRPQPERLERFDGTLAGETQDRAMYAIGASWLAILVYLWFRFGNWTFGAAAVVCLIHDLCFTLGAIGLCYYVHDTAFGQFLGLQDFKIDFPAVAALLTLVGYSVNDTIVVFDRIREVRGKNPRLTPEMINDSVNQTLSRTILASLTMWLVVIVLYIFGGEGVHLFAFVMVVGVIVGTYSSIYIASPLLLIFGEGENVPDDGRHVAAPTPAAVSE